MKKSIFFFRRLSSKTIIKMSCAIVLVWMAFVFVPLPAHMKYFWKSQFAVVLVCHSSFDKDEIIECDNFERAIERNPNLIFKKRVKKFGETDVLQKENPHYWVFFTRSTNEETGKSLHHFEVSVKASSRSSALLPEGIIYSTSNISIHGEIMGTFESDFYTSDKAQEIVNGFYYAIMR